MGGRIRRDNRFVLQEKAQEIQQNLMTLKKRGINMNDLPETLGVATSVISRAAGGRAGDIPQPRFGNLSSTDFILQKLQEMVGDPEAEKE